MSQSFRAVKEMWNVHSSCFIEPEMLMVTQIGDQSLPLISRTPTKAQSPGAILRRATRPLSLPMM
jgi:hypothetical protein